MSVQHIDAPKHRRTTFIAVALLLVALAVGAVTAVRLFPAAATQRPVAAATWSGSLGRIDNSASGRGDSLVRSAGASRRQRPVAEATWSGALGH
jgi:hypothetical protein